MMRLTAITGLFHRAGRLRAWLLVTALILLPGTVLAENPRLALPRSHLGQPEPAPIFLTGYLGFGGAPDYDLGSLGYGGQIIFQPGSASAFLNQLYSWNSSLIIQFDYQKVTEDSRILSADLIVRHYLSDRRLPETLEALFVGAGIGASHVRLPLGEPDSETSYFSFVAEMGKEWDLRRDLLVVTRFQFRYYNYGGYNVSTWAFSVGAGIPVPW